MITNYDQLMKHNKQFYDSFIDLKAAGWKSYSKALNSYTLGYFSAQLKQVDTAVEDLAVQMKNGYNA